MDVEKNWEAAAAKAKTSANKHQYPGPKIVRADSPHISLLCPLVIIRFSIKLKKSSDSALESSADFDIKQILDFHPVCGKLLFD